MTELRHDTKRRTLFGVFALIMLASSSLSISQTVQPADKAILEKLIAERNGKILLLNIWATWCEPCREEFPDLVKLYRELNPAGVDIVGISVDYPDEIHSKILPFLASMKADLPVYVADFPSQDEFFALFDKSWSGGVPMTFIYDANGEQQAALLGKRSITEFKKAIEDARKKR